MLSILAYLRRNRGIGHLKKPLRNWRTLVIKIQRIRKLQRIFHNTGMALQFNHPASKPLLTRLTNIYLKSKRDSESVNKRGFLGHGSMDNNSFSWAFSQRSSRSNLSRSETKYLATTLSRRISYLIDSCVNIKLVLGSRSSLVSTPREPLENRCIAHTLGAATCVLI